MSLTHKINKFQFDWTILCVEMCICMQLNISMARSQYYLMLSAIDMICPLAFGMRWCPGWFHCLPRTCCAGTYRFDIMLSSMSHVCNIINMNGRYNKSNTQYSLPATNQWANRVFFCLFTVHFDNWCLNVFQMPSILTIIIIHHCSKCWNISFGIDFQPLSIYDLYDKHNSTTGILLRIRHHHGANDNC